MNRSSLGRAAFSAMVALSIGFGVREAMASPAAARARPFCEDQADCEATCAALYPTKPGGFCSSGHTCYCYGVGG